MFAFSLGFCDVPPDERTRNMDASGAKPKLLVLIEKVDELEVIRLEVPVVVPLLPPDSPSSSSVGRSEVDSFGVVAGEGSVITVDGGVVVESGVEVLIGDCRPDEIERDDTERVL